MVVKDVHAPRLCYFMMYFFQLHNDIVRYVHNFCSWLKIGEVPLLMMVVMFYKWEKYFFICAIVWTNAKVM